MLKICNRPLDQFHIVLPEKPHPAEVHAAELLREYAKLACGVELNGDAAIHIGGDRPTDGICWDGFSIETDETDLYLFGAIPRGTLYAVYGFAEKYLGIRRYAPEVTRVVAPAAETIVPNHREIDNPGFGMRINDWITHVQDKEFAAWERMNGYALDDALGGYVVNIGHCHTFERLCPPKTYFAEHPEYYSLFNGRRIPAGNAYDSEENGQLCLTNPDVLRIVTENVLEWLRAHPEADIVDVSQNDNDRYCQCPACAASDAEEGSPSGTILKFVNAVAEAVEKEFPHVLVQTFAYSYSRKAPRITKPRKNVLIRYCTIEACFRHRLDDESCPRNAGKFAKELKEWGAISDHIAIWDYVTNYSCYIAPFPNFEVLRENIRFFYENNAVHVFEEDTPGTRAGDLNDLQAYLIAKLLWDPMMSEARYQTLIDEFLAAYFGAGWRQIRKYMQIAAETTADRHMGCFEYADLGYLGSDPKSELYIPRPYAEVNEQSYLSGLTARIDEVRALWDEAYAMAADAGERERIDRCRLSIDYLWLFCVKHDRDTMTPAERMAYEREVAIYYGKKQRYGIHTNIWTQRAGH
ncbi:MAG: DUF4838 domain-containing protein [Ruminococcaceae bacterium]|nr:DUF4838 domain-containing protein [Oscillospiraceae bacterium]